MLRPLSAPSPAWRQATLAGLALLGVALAGLALAWLVAPPPAPPAPPADAPVPLRPSRGFAIAARPDGSMQAFAQFVDPERGLGFRPVTLPPPGADLSPPETTGAEVWLPPATVHQFSMELERAGAPPARVVERWGVDLEEGRVQLYAFRDMSWAALALGVGLLVLLAGLAVGLVVTARRLRAERRERRALVRAHQWKEAAREAERARLAREIHDGPLQDLHALRMRVALPAGGDGAPPDAALGEAANAVALELRAIAEGLRPPALSRFGLGAALEAHARRLRQRGEVSVSVEAFDDADRLHEEARTALFRIGQEAISNAIQHGRARAVQVRVWAEPTPEAPARLRLTVADDGVGLGDLDPEALVADGHFGVAGMRERAALLGASFSLDARPDGGTLVSLRAPWPSVAAGAPSEAAPLAAAPA